MSVPVKEGVAMDENLRRHLSDMLAQLQPLVEMAQRKGVPPLAAARLRAAAFEIRATLDPVAAERRHQEDVERDRETMETLHKEEEKGVWGYNQA
jgi:hypothetical protein